MLRSVSNISPTITILCRLAASILCRLAACMAAVGHKSSAGFKLSVRHFVVQSFTAI